MGSLTERQRLDLIDSRMRLIDATAFMLGTDSEGEFVDARGADGSLVTVLRFAPHATPDERDFVINSLNDVRFLLDFAFRALRYVQEQKRAAATPAPVKKDHTTEAAMLCESPAFKRFLMEEHGLESPATTDRTAQKLRSLLSITSRKDLNNDDGARERWFALRAKFNIWKGRAMS